MIVSSMSRMGGTVGKRKRNDTAVKVDAELVRIAKVIAADYEGPDWQRRSGCKSIPARDYGKTPSIQLGSLTHATASKT